MKIQNVKHIGHLDIPGGGQVYVKGRVAYIGQMAPPVGTSIVDVSEPQSPKILAQLNVPPTTHCHKARVNSHNILVVNYDRTHHPLRSGDRLFIGCWFGGYAIADITDMTRPRTVSHRRYSPPYPAPTHTALRIPFKLRGRDILVVSDEHITDEKFDPCPFLWMVDIADPFRPEEVGYFIPDPVGGGRSAQSNDVFYDGNGFLYLIDRFNGLDILERRR